VCVNACVVHDAWCVVRGKRACAWCAWCVVHGACGGGGVASSWSWSAVSCMSVSVLAPRLRALRGTPAAC
jgi:hypothetical protein